MTRHRQLLVSVVLLTSACSSAPQREDQSDDRNLQTLAEERASAAGEVMQEMKQRYLANEPLTLDFQERWATWSRRQMNAEIDAARDRATRVAAAERHLESCRRLLYDFEHRRTENPRPALIRQRYHIADADYRLAQVKAAK